MDAGQSSQSISQRTEFIKSPYKETQTKAVREYEETISQLKKENFDLKVRLYLCEEAHKETYHAKGSFNDEKEECVQVIVNLKIETEDLKKELKGKDDEIQNTIEKYAAAVKKYEKELKKQKELIEILEQLPTADDYDEVRRQYSAMVSDSEHMRQLLGEKDEEIEKLQKEIVVFSKKVKQRDEAIKACAMKYHKEIDHIPKDLRPIIKAAIEAAVNNDENKLLSSLEKFKKSLKEIMGIATSSNVEDSIKKNATESELSEPLEGDLDPSNVTSNESESYLGKSSKNDLSVADIETISKLQDENEMLIQKAEESNKIIENLTITCSEIKEREQELSNKLEEAYAKINCLIDELEKKQYLVPSDFNKCDLSCQTDIAWNSLQSTISDRNLQDFGTSNNISELKEEILMLILAIEQKDKELSDCNQKILSLNDSNVLNENYLAEREELQQRLALSCSINNDLLSHLQSLEKFLEDVLEQKNFSSSSLENVNENSDFLEKISNYVKKSKLLSQTLSNELSICEGSRFFDLNDTTMHRSDRESIGQSSLWESDIQHTSQEGMSKFFPNVKEKQNVLGSDMFNPSEMYSSHKLQSFNERTKNTGSLSTKSNNVVVLKTSNNEDLILLLNDDGDPKDVLIRNNGAYHKDSDQHRRRCWDTPTKDDFWNSEKFAAQCNQHVYNVENSSVFKSNYLKYNAWVSSDSDTWSEPDRNISMQRIGIDIQTSPITSRSPRKSRFKDKRAAEDSTKNESASSYVKLHSFSKRRRNSETPKSSFTCKKCQKQSQQLDDTLQEETAHFQELQKLYVENSNQQMEIENLSEMLKIKVNSIESLTEEKTVLIKDINELKEKLKELKRNNDFLNSQQNEFLSQLEEKDSLNKELQDIISNLETSVKTSDAACEELKTELEQTKERLAILDRKCAKYENTHSRDETESFEKLSALEKRERELLENINDMTLQKDSLLDKVKEEERRAEEATKKHIEMLEKVRSMSREILQLKDSNDMLEKRNSSLLDTNASSEMNLKTSHSQKEVLMSKIRSLEEKIKSLESDCESLHVKISSLVDSKQNIIDLLSSFESSLKMNLKTINDACDFKFDRTADNLEDIQEMSHLIDEDENINELLKNIIVSNLELKDIASGISQQKEDLSNMKKAIEEEKHKSSILKNKIMLKEEENKTLKEEIDRLQLLNDAIYELQSSADSYKAEQELLEQQLEQNKNNLSVLEKENSELEEKLKILLNEKNNSEQALNSAKIELSSLQKRLLTEKSSEDYENIVKLKQKEIEDLHKQLQVNELSKSRSDHELQLKQESLLKDIKNLKGANHELEKHMQVLQNSENSLEQLLKSSDAEVSSLQNQLQSLREEFKNSSEKCKADCKNLESLLEQKEKNLRSLETKNDKLEEKIENVLREKNSIEQALRSANFELSSLQKRPLEEKSIEKYESLVDLKQKEIDKLQEEIHSQEINQSKSDNNLLQKQKSLLDDIKNLTDKNHELKDDIQILQNDKSRLEQALKSANGEISNLRDRLQSLNKEVYKLQTSAEAFKGDRESLENLKSILKQKEEDLKNSEQNNSELEKELKMLLNDKNSNEQALKFAKAELSSLQKSSMFEKSNDKYEKLLDSKEKEIAKLQEATKSDHELIRKHKSLLENVRNLNKINHELENQIKILENNKMSLEQSLKLTNDELSTLQESLRTKNEEHKNSLDLKQKQIDYLQKRITTLQSQVNEISHEKVDYSDKNQTRLKKTLERAASPDSSTIVDDNLQNASESLLNSDNSFSSVNSLKKEQMVSSDTFKNDKEKYKKCIKLLQSKLEARDNRIEMLEKEKNSLQENLLSFVRKGKRGSLEKTGEKDEIVVELKSKQSFIEELKSGLYKAHDSLIDKQKEIDKLTQELFELRKMSEDFARTQHHSNRFSDTSLRDAEDNISDLRKQKKELMNSLLGLQKQFYESNNINLNYFEKLTRNIENLRALQVNPSLCKADSDPILNSSSATNIEQIKSWDRVLKNVQIDMEVDIECLQSFKIFLKRFLSPSMTLSQTKAEEVMQPKPPTIIQKKDLTKLSLKNISSGVEQLGIQGVEPSHDRLATVAFSISEKLDWIQSVLRTVMEEFEHLGDIQPSIEETTRERAAKLILQKLFDGLECLQEKANEVFYMNSRLKSLELFDGYLNGSCNKQDMSDHESLLSEETIALSRSASLSPVSFDGQFAPNFTLKKLKERTLVQSYIRQSEEIRRTPLRPSHKIISSSQDSVFQRSHYSSPDLGIESDPNHEHSAPEQVDKFHSTKINASYHELSGSTMYRDLDRHRLSSIYDFSDNSFKLKDKGSPFVMSCNLRAIGALEDYELLKNEISECIVGIKSILARTGNGMQQIANNGSPKKKLEYSTFKAIKDTCLNIEVCLQKASKLVKNFWVATCPTEEELRILLQQNEELNSKLKRILELKENQEKDFKDVIDRLKKAEAIKQKQEKEMSKKLVETKKVLRRAEKKYLQVKNQELLLLPSSKMPSNQS